MKTAAATCSRWLEFLDQVIGDEKHIRTLQRWFGWHAMPADEFPYPSLDRMVVIRGLRRSGKTSILKVLRAVAGGDCVASSGLGLISERFGLSHLVGFKAVILDDGLTCPARDLDLVAERMKRILAGERVLVERMRERPRLVELPHRFTAVAESDPPIFARLNGRLVVIPTRTVPVDHQVSQMSLRLLEELDGIQAWAQEGREDLVAANGMLV